MKRLTKQTICLILVVSIICSMSVVAFATDLSLGSDGSDTYTLENAKWKVISSTLGGIEHPHYTESYYLLATKLS